MKRLLFIFFIMVSTVMVMNAQSGLEINSIFNGRYATDPNVTETIISGKNKFLKKHKLNVLATFKGPASSYRSIVERMVLADASKSIGKSVRYKDGRLYFGLFILKPIVSNNVRMNRYLYYLDNSNHKNPTVLVVYLEGTLNEQQVSDFIQSLTSKSK
ncbi:hypothetical protein HDR70_07215 [bacterium]|nr:hypothetical protein [bacterium]